MARVPPTRYFDSSVLIKWVMNDPEAAPIIDRLLDDVRAGRWKIAITPLVLVEVTRERGQRVDLSRAAVIESFFDNDAYFFPREIDMDLGKAARALIYDHLYLRPNDALHLAAALDLGCQVLYTYDAELLRLDGLDDLRIEIPRDDDLSDLPLFGDQTP